MKGVEGDVGEAVGAAKGVEGEGDDIVELKGFEGAVEKVGEEVVGGRGGFGGKEEDNLELLTPEEVVCHPIATH